MPTATDVAEFRAANAELARRCQADLMGFWASLDTSKPEVARNALLRFVPELTTAYGDASAVVAADWYDAMRATDGAQGRYAAEQAETFAKQWVEGRVRYGSRHLFTDDPDAMVRFLDGAVQEYALQPGRDTIVQAAVRDPASRGWARSVRAGACDFCRMLAGRGAVYRSETVRFVAHGDCHCVPVPEWSTRSDDRTVIDTGAPPMEPATEPSKAAPTLPAPEEEYVKKLEALLRSKQITPAQLQQQAAAASPLGQANVAAAVERYAAARALPAKGFASAQEARDWAASHWPGPEGYTPAQLAALRSYTGSGYAPINSTLRSSKGKRTTKAIRDLDSAMDAAPRVPEDITVVRNTSLRQLGITTARADPKTAVGKEFVDHGYLSTSVNRRGAMQGEVRMEIRVPKGSRGVYVSGSGGPKSSKIISDYGGGESELLLDRGSRLQIVSVVKSGKRWTVVADLIQDGVGG